MITVSDTPKGAIIEGYQVHLRPVSEQDLETLRQWRNSEHVARQMVSSEPISTEQQHAWFQKISRDPSQRHWVVEYKGVPIGATNVKTVVMNQTVDGADILEPGLYIGHPDYIGNMIAFAPTLALYDYCFERLATTRFRARVKPNNTAALKYNQQLGYEIVNQQDFAELHLHKEAYQRQTECLKQWLSRSRK